MSSDCKPSGPHGQRHMHKPLIASLRCARRDRTWENWEIVTSLQKSCFDARGLTSWGYLLLVYYMVGFTMSTGARSWWYPTIINRFVDNDICKRPYPRAYPVPTRMANHQVTGSNIRPTASANALCAWPWHPRRPKGHWAAAFKKAHIQCLYRLHRRCVC